MLFRTMNGLGGGTGHGIGSADVLEALVGWFSSDGFWCLEWIQLSGGLGCDEAAACFGKDGDEYVGDADMTMLVM